MKRFFNLIKIFISIALLALLFWMVKDKLTAIACIIKSANKALVVCSFAVMISGMILQSFRLKILLDIQKVHLRIKDLIQLTFIGQFFNNFMPTAIGGDVIKAYYASGKSAKKLETFGSIALDRILGVITLMWIALIGLLVCHNYIAAKRAVIIIIGIISAAGVLFMAFVFNETAAKAILLLRKAVKKENFKEKITRLYQITANYRRHKKAVLSTFLLSVVAQFAFFYMAYLLALSISSDISFVVLMVILPVISAVSMLPSINGLGIRESGFVYFLSDKIGTDKAFALSILYLGATISVSLIGGIIFLFKREFKHLQT